MNQAGEQTPGALVSEVKAGKPTTEDFPEPVYGGEPAGSSETRRQLKRNRTGGSVVSESDVAIADERDPMGVSQAAAAALTRDAGGSAE